MLDAAMKLKVLAPWGKSYDKPRQVLKRNITLLAKVHLVKVMVFPVVMYGCESRTIRCLSAKELMLSNCGVGGDFKSPLDCKEILSVHPKGNQS